MQRRTGESALASGKTLDPARPERQLIGRDAELARIDHLLAQASAGRAGTLVLEGPSGIGKTALLDAAAARARGFTCLTARGIESEAAVGHGCLLELLAPLRGRLDDVPPGQAAALGTALGWSSAASPGDRFLVAAGTMALFAARRVHHDRVAFLLARRPGSLPGLDGLEVLRVADLAAGAATDLLSRRVARTVVERLVEQVGGNPLALLEVAAHLTPGQRSGAAPLPEILPVADGLAGLFDPELAALSPGARTGLVVLAASRDGRTGHVSAALEPSGVAAHAALDEDERSRLVVRDRDVVTFRHPLVRASVWSAATPEERRAAHLALAATGRDDDLAADLVALAERERAQRDFATSSAILERAAELTTDAALSAERLAVAVTDASLGGDAGRTRALADRTLNHGSGATRAAALRALGRLEERSGSVPVARDLLRDAAAASEGRPRVAVLAELAGVQHRLGDVAGLAATAEAIADAPHAGPEDDALSDWVRGAALLHAGDVGPGRELVRRALDRMDDEPSLRDEPNVLVYAVLGLGWLEDVRSAVPQVERRLRAARERGALGVLVAALSMTAYGRGWYLGDHAGAFADAGEAVELAEHLGYVADAAPAEELLAWEYAARGRHDEAHRHLDRARALVARAGTLDVAAHLALTAAFCALCRGDLAGTAALLEARVAVDGGVGALGEPLGVAPLLVEAYAGSGRRRGGRSGGAIRRGDA